MTLAFTLLGIIAVLGVAAIAAGLWRDRADVHIDARYRLPKVRQSWHWQIRRETGVEEDVDHEVHLIERARQRVAARIGRRPRP